MWSNRRRRSTREKKKEPKFNLDRRAANKAALTEEENAELKTLNADTEATRRNSQNEEQKAEANKKQCVKRASSGGEQQAEVNKNPNPRASRVILGMEGEGGAFTTLCAFWSSAQLGAKDEPIK